MRTNQRPGGNTHALDIQRPVVPGHFMGQMRGPNGIVIDHIAIAPGNGRKPRVKIQTDRRNPAQRDIRRQVGIGSMNPVSRRTMRVTVKVNHLAGRVNPGIGAASTENLYRMICHAPQRLLHGLLHAGYTRLLALPAAIGRTLVLDASRHSGNNSGRLRGGRCCEIKLCHQSARCSIMLCASCFCWSLPSSITSLRISRAPSWSPISM